MNLCRREDENTLKDEEQESNVLFLVLSWVKLKLR